MNTVRAMLAAAALFVLILPASYGDDALSPPQPPAAPGVGRYVPGHFVQPHTVKPRHIRGYARADGTYVAPHYSPGGFKPGRYVEGRFVRPRSRRR